MTNPATDFMASSACSACSSCARGAVHHFALPGMGFRAAHGLLGISKKNKEVPGGKRLEHFASRSHFFRNVRASVQFAKTHAPQGTPANGQGLGTRRSVPVAAVTNDLPRATRAPTPPSPAGCPPRPGFRPAITCPIGHPRRVTSAPPRRNGGIGRTGEQPDRRAISFF